MVQKFLAGSLFLLVPLCLGCGDPGSAPTAKVEGTVTLDGAPLANAPVQFTAVSGGGSGKGAGRQATGMTDSAGKFSLSTFKTNDGAMPGNYMVSVGGDVPDKYKDPSKSELKATVEAGKTNTVKLELKKEG